METIRPKSERGIRSPYLDRKEIQDIGYLDYFFFYNPDYLRVFFFDNSCF